MDILFEKYFSKSPSIKNMIGLLDFPDIVNMYKKELLLNLEGKEVKGQDFNNLVSLITLCITGWY